MSLIVTVRIKICFSVNIRVGVRHAVVVVKARVGIQSKTKLYKGI